VSKKEQERERESCYEAGRKGVTLTHASRARRGREEEEEEELPLLLFNPFALSTFLSRELLFSSSRKEVVRLPHVGLKERMKSDRRRESWTAARERETKGKNSGSW
jgi:hypothetical protein